MREAIGAGVQFAVAQSPVAEHHRLSRGIPGGLFLEQFVDAAVARTGGVRRIPRFGDETAFGLGDDGEPHDAFRLVCRHAFQQEAVAFDDPFRRVTGEQGPRVRQCARDMAINFPIRQDKIAAGASTPRGCVVAVVQYKHRLEQRVVRKVRSQSGKFHDLVEGDIAMFPRAGNARVCATQKFGHGRLS